MFHRYSCVAVDSGQVQPEVVRGDVLIDGPSYFADELAELSSPGGLVDEGMATVTGPSVGATELGMLFVRRLAAVFDAHTAHRTGDRSVFSKTV